MGDEIPPVRPRFEPLLFDWSLPDDRTPEASSPWQWVFVALDFVTLGLFGLMVLVVVGPMVVGAAVVRAVRDPETSESDSVTP